MNDMKNDTTNDIIIDLTQDLSPDTIKVTHLIHQESFERLADLITTALPGTSNAHNKVFFIDGTRGAGKSTFLAAVSKALPEKLKDSAKLCNLPVIDPTMMETGEMHVIFPILVEIKKKVEGNRKGCESWDTKNNSYEEWRKQLQKLARGANLLNRVKQSAGSLDDFLSLDEGMENASSGAQLCVALHEFLKSSAAILSVQAFIIAFDDVDTNFDKGWEVLELIRRYLQCPHVVVLITGDLQLYTHLVRQQQFKNLGDDLHKHDQDRKRERDEMVDHLEQQYLMKLFPLQNRVPLYPLINLLSEKIDGKENSSHPTYWVNVKKPELISEYIKKIVREGLLIQQDAQVKIFSDFLLALPLRAVVQILRTFQPVKTPISLNKLLGTPPTPSEPMGTSITPKKLAEALRSALMGSLYKLNIDINALSQGRQGKLIEAVFDSVVRDGEFDTGIYLRPQSRDESLRNAYVALSAEVATQCYQQPARAIRYFLVALGSIALLQKHRPAGADIAINSTYVEQFKKTMSVGREEDSMNWARYAAPILLAPNGSQKSVGAGVFKWSHHKLTATIPSYLLQEVLDIKDSDHPRRLHPLQNIAIRIATHQVEGASHTQQYASIFNLLSGIERLLDINNYANSADEIKSALEIKLTQLCSIVTVKAPSWLPHHSANIDAAGILFTAREIAGIEKEIIKESLPSFTSWLAKAKELEKCVMPSALFLGKVWPRLYFSLSKISDSRYYYKKIAKDGPAYLMHIYVICLLNAFLVEELDHHYHNNEMQENKKITTMDRTNPIHDAIPFFNKLSSLRFDSDSLESKELELSDFDKYFPFTMLIMRCPLIVALLTHYPENDSDKTLKPYEKIKYPKFFSELYQATMKNEPPNEQAANKLMLALQTGMTTLSGTLIESEIPPPIGESKHYRKCSQRRKQISVMIKNP